MPGLKQRRSEKNSAIFDESGDDRAPVSLILPVCGEAYEFPGFPPFLGGLLPKGLQLQALLCGHKSDHHDDFHQLVSVGEDRIGPPIVGELPEVTLGLQVFRRESEAKPR